jgi:hypothetical protein
MATDTVTPEAKYTVEDLFTAYIAYDRRQKPLGGPGHETPEASWTTVLAEARTCAAKGSYQGTTLAEFAKHFDATKGNGTR